jgi:hypothetical protein
MSKSGCDTKSWIPWKKIALMCSKILNCIGETWFEHMINLLSPEFFRKGELVLVLRRPIVLTGKAKGKLEPKWEGPFVIEQVYDGGAYQLINQEGERPMPPINGRFLNKYTRDHLRKFIFLFLLIFVLFLFY